MLDFMAHNMMVSWCAKLGSLYKLIECCTHIVLLFLLQVLFVRYLLLFLIR